MGCCVPSPPISVLEHQGETESPKNIAQKHLPESIHPTVHHWLFITPSVLKICPPSLKNLPGSSHPWNDPKSSYWCFQSAPWLYELHLKYFHTVRFLFLLNELWCLKWVGEQFLDSGIWHHIWPNSPPALCLYYRCKLANWCRSADFAPQPPPLTAAKMGWDWWRLSV